MVQVWRGAACTSSLRVKPWRFATCSISASAAKPPDDKAWIANARESFSGRLLTDRQFSDAIALTGILRRQVLETGAFLDKLGDFAFAFARSERFDAMKAETIIRDLFRERFGQTLNQLREERMTREAALTEDDRALALGYAIVTGEKVAQGHKLTFHRALTSQAKRFEALLTRIVDATNPMVIKSYETRLGELERERVLLASQMQKQAEPQGTLTSS